MYTKTYYQPRTSSNCYAPAVNVVEDENSYKLEVSVPGYNKEDIHIRIDNDRLVLNAEAKEGDEKTHYLRREFSVRSGFERSFKLPSNGLAENITAEYHNGLLFVNIPKREKVEIKIDDANWAN